MNGLEETKISSREIFKGNIVHLFVDDITLPDGKPAKREVIRHIGAVGVVALTDKNEIVMVKQYRYPFARVTLEIPAGKLESNEDILVSAKRELSEETGITAEHFTYLGEAYSSPAVMDETIHLYLAEDLTFKDAHPDSDEFILSEKLTLEKALSMVLCGEIKDGKTQIAVMKAYLLLQKRKQ